MCRRRAAYPRARTWWAVSLRDAVPAGGTGELHAVGPPASGLVGVPSPPKRQEGTTEMLDGLTPVPDRATGQLTVHR